MLLLGACALSLTFGVGAAQADTTVFNSVPADGWTYGSGNNYAPSNTAVLTTDAGDELSLRLHERFQPASASVSDVYSFGLGPLNLSYDWGIDIHGAGSFSGVTALLTFTNLAGGSFNYNPLSTPNDNSIASGHQQNSYYMNNFPGLNFNPLVDSTYNVNLTVNGLDGGTKSLDVVAKFGNGNSAAVPEPATWAMMLLGFGALGATLRRRRGQVALAA